MSPSHGGRISPSTDFDDSSSLDKLQVEDPLDCELEASYSSSLYPKPVWKRILGAVVPGASVDKDAGGWLPVRSSNALRPNRSQRRSWRFRFSYCLLIPTLSFFVMLGAIQFVSILCGIVISYFPDEFDHAASHWLFRGPADADGSRWPTDISRDIIPVGCHSHNDYWRRVPLFSALQAGCIGVEADVWLFGDELYVGHSTSALTPKRTLRSMYVDPLVGILDQQNPTTEFHAPADDVPLNGVFDTDPAQTLVLLIDFKTNGSLTWPYVVEQLSPLRERGYLSYFNGEELVNGPITVVGTGNTPFDLVTNSTQRDIFFDAPLDLLANDTPDEGSDNSTTEQSTENLGQGLSGASGLGPDAFNSTNSFYASVSFKKSIGSAWPFHFTRQQMDLIRAQIRGAHHRGLKARYWGLPEWPRSLRNHIWSVLVREGVDILNVDDLQSATKQEWTPRVSDWWF